MNRYVLDGLLLAVLLGANAGRAVSEQTPYGGGMTEANKERLVLDDMQDVSDWYNGSPEETQISATTRHVKQGKSSLLFANLVDHTKGEKNYPIGWPRTGKDVAKTGTSDWSDYDFFECWIYAETSRESLPGTPLGIGFYHSGPKRSTSLPLNEVKKDQWTKIVVPIAELIDPRDVRRIQFHISESNYKHGDRVDFYVSDPVLTRFVQPTIASLTVDRKLLYANDRQITAHYTLMGHKGLEEVQVEFEIGQADPPAAETAGKVSPQGELPLAIPASLAPGTYWARLGLRDPQGKLIDRSQVQFRVIQGPF